MAEQRWRELYGWERSCTGRSGSEVGRVAEIAVPHAINLTARALRLADAMEAKGIDPDLAEAFGSGGRLVVAQLAEPDRPGHKVSVPSDACWHAALTVVRHHMRARERTGVSS